MNRLKTMIDVLMRPRLLKLLLSMNANGYLKEIGWIDSFDAMMPVDKDKRPIPWVTYSFIAFIGERLTKELEIFEFGSGNSTLWYAKKVKFVMSVEHDKEWVEKIKKEMPENVSLNHVRLEDGKRYSMSAATSEKKYDIIIIDGRDRVRCIIDSMPALAEEGVFVLDDSEREKYAEGVRALNENGFKKIDFWGIAPGIFFNKCTTVFYKDRNCLGI